MASIMWLLKYIWQKQAEKSPRDKQLVDMTFEKLNYRFWLTR